MVNLKMPYVVGALSPLGAEGSFLEAGFSLAHLGTSVAPEKYENVDGFKLLTFAIIPKSHQKWECLVTPKTE